MLFIFRDNECQFEMVNNLQKLKKCHTVVCLILGENNKVSILKGLYQNFFTKNGELGKMYEKFLTQHICIPEYMQKKKQLEICICKAYISHH